MIHSTKIYVKYQLGQRLGVNDLLDNGFFFFQAEDGIRDAQESRGLGDVYKRQLTPARPFLR